MRIVFVLPGSGISGGVRSTQRLASGLLERGHDVSVLYRQAPFRPRDVARNLYIRLRYRDTSEWLRSFRGRTQAYRQLTATAVGRNDVILAVGPVAARDVARIPDACGIKVENVHGTGQGPSLVLEAWRRRWPRIVVATHLQRAIEEAQCGPVAAVVPNGVDTSEYFPDCSSSDRTGVGTVWNAGRIKGPDTVLAALAQLRSSYPDLPFFMFSSQPRPRDLPSGVTFVRRPSVAVARRLYSRCRVWFCASRSEGFGLPLLEAMACGCAVVSSDCGGPGDIIRSGENGLLVPVGDAKGMAAAILQLLRDATLREKFVAASQMTLERFTWPKAVDGFEAALRSILEECRGRRTPSSNAVDPRFPTQGCVDSARLKTS